MDGRTRHQASRRLGEPPAEVHDTLVLSYDARQKRRFLAKLVSGDEIAVMLPHGTVLKDGDYLETDTGRHILIRAAQEPVSVASTTDSLLLAKVAYHLGNRHVPLQIAAGRVSYRHDHVLDDLATRLGAEVSFERAPFSPEGGAYGRGGHAHHHEPGADQAHDHAHDHVDDHAHPHEHDHASDAHDHAHTHDHASDAPEPDSLPLEPPTHESQNPDEYGQNEPETHVRELGSKE